MTKQTESDRTNLKVPVSTAARSARRGHAATDAGVRAFVVEAARLLHWLHCEDVLVLDVRGASDVTDYVLIASGTSQRQILSVVDDVQKLARERGLGVFGKEADDAANWAVLDLVDMVVHVFEPVTRAHYDLEMMWGDAPQVDWQIPQDNNVNE